MEAQIVAADGPTPVEQVALPIEDVELRRLRTKAGKPVVVRCEFVDEETILRVTEGLPGASPEIGIVSAEERAERRVESVRRLLAYARPIIEAGTVLQKEDGTEVRPAFFFEADPGNGALPGRFLSASDRSLLFVTIMRLSGYAGGPADSFRVDGGKREGGGDGARPLDARASDGDAAAPTPRVHGGEAVPDPGPGRSPEARVEEGEPAGPPSA